LAIGLLLSACSGAESADHAGVPDASSRGALPRADGPPEGGVRPGIDVLLADSLYLVAGTRVGLITNPTGVGAEGTSTIDLLGAHPAVELVRLFAPEHGLRAELGEGQTVQDGEDPASGLPVVSLYGVGKRAPSHDDLADLDALLFDMQDVGARYYTYVYTMALAMEAAGEARVPFIVLDRPNPIGGTLVQGNVLDPDFATFVGRYPIPMRHGMTPGELARLWVAEFGIDVELHVVPVAGWKRGTGFAETGLPWIPPSPNIPTVESALHYPGLCLFEGTNLSVGRGTERPFQQVGAPWLDAEAVAATLNTMGLPGALFEAVRFTPEAPTDGKFGGVELAGVRVTATDPQIYDPTRAAVALLVETHRMAQADGQEGAAPADVAASPWEWNVAHFDRLAGTDALRRGIEAGLGLDQLTASWPRERAAFSLRRDDVLIYRPR
jgi:uncharacterized protein YbbC (DUF1343 family)